MDGLFAPHLETFRPSSGVDRDRLPMLFSRRLQRRHSQLDAGRQRLTDRLFFAVLPDAATAEDIADRARRLRLSHGLTGKPLETEQFHVPLFHVGGAVCDPPTELLEAQSHWTRHSRSPCRSPKRSRLPIKPASSIET